MGKEGRSQKMETFMKADGDMTWLLDTGNT